MPDMSRGDTRLLIEECKMQGLLRNQAANVLAQCLWETAGTMKPIREKGGEKYLRAKKYYPYVGMGYIQLTWKANYEDWSRRIGVDFVKDPKLLLKPEYAARIAVEGMKLGTFTGKKLSDFITLSKSDHFNARAIVNGDKSKVVGGKKIGAIIAEYAREYDGLLKAEGYGVEPAQPGAQPEPAPPKPAPTETPTAEMAMKLGDKGDLVAELQRNLNALGMGPVKVDGEFGDVTRKAVEAFQATHEDDAGVPLKVDGLAGPRTMKAIAAALLAPKIDAAERNIPATADEAVKEKTSLWTKIVGAFGGSGVLGLGWLTGMDWKAVIAAGVVVVVLIGILLLLQNQIVAAFDKINGKVTP